MIQNYLLFLYITFPVEPLLFPFLTIQLKKGEGWGGDFVVGISLKIQKKKEVIHSKSVQYVVSK